MVLKDPRVVLANRDRRLMYQGTFVVGFLSTLVGMGVIVGVYLSPDYPAVLPDHNLSGQWEIDFEELGLSKEEALDRVNLGYVLHGVVVTLYMFIAVSGRLVVSIHQGERGVVRTPLVLVSSLWLGRSFSSGPLARVSINGRRYKRL